MSDGEVDSFSKLREEVKKEKDKTDHKQIVFDPFERKSKANYKKKKEEIKYGENKRGHLLPEDPDEWDDGDWEAYYGS